MTEKDIEVMKCQLELYKLATTDERSQKANLDKINRLIDELWRYKVCKQIVSFDAYGLLEWPKGHELENQGNILLRALHGIYAGYERTCFHDFGYGCEI